MLAPLDSARWTPACAAHLLNRAGFGGTPAEIREMHALGLKRAVGRMMSGGGAESDSPPPSLTAPEELYEQARMARGLSSEEQKRELRRRWRREQMAEMRALRAWWLERMRRTTFPLREKMTLFWHGHFATGVEKVRAACLMWRQNEMFRTHALGSFRELAKEVSRDPAMMRYLDLQKSRRGKPNENFARELMELFLLGEGVCYTEKDVREAARAFTGYRIAPKRGEFVFQRRQFDSDNKMFLGRTGPFDGDAVIGIILEQPECAEFLMRKLWAFFVSDRPNPAVVRAAADALRAADFHIGAVLERIFLSREFYAPEVVRSQIKSPVQWMIGSTRALEATLPPPTILESALKQLGQNLFAPPNVKGWEGGRAWIGSSTYLLRCNLAGYMVSGRPPALAGFRRASGGVVDIPLEKIAPAELRKNPEALCDELSFRMLNARLQMEEREQLLEALRRHEGEIDDAALRDFLHLLMSTPDYQLT